MVKTYGATAIFRLVRPWTGSDHDKGRDYGPPGEKRVCDMIYLGAESSKGNLNFSSREKAVETAKQLTYYDFTLVEIESFEHVSCVEGDIDVTRRDIKCHQIQQEATNE
ncbi:MAG TPA: hypothetical protein VMV86_00320 [Methanosarcinales archaeon]|nr:hypothetical protein [Methanosarcinales archaeon]